MNSTTKRNHREEPATSFLDAERQINFDAVVQLVTGLPRNTQRADGDDVQRLIDYGWGL